MVVLVSYCLINLKKIPEENFSLEWAGTTFDCTLFLAEIRMQLNVDMSYYCAHIVENPLLIIQE